MIYQKICWKKLVFNLFQAITKKIYSFWNMELWKLSQMVNIALFYRLWVDNLADNLAFGLQHLWVSQDSSSSLQRTQHFSKLLLFISPSSSVSWFRNTHMLMFGKKYPGFHNFSAPGSKKSFLYILFLKLEDPTWTMCASTSFS